jgi:hypothetical protein
MRCRRSIIAAVLAFQLLSSSGKCLPLEENSKTPIKVTLISERISARIGDSIVLTVEVKNVSDAPIFLYGKLRWGPSSSLFLLVTDDKGKSAPMGFFEDALPPMPSANDKTLFLSLQPEHFFGISRTDKVSDLVFIPGIYYLQVEYHGPVPRRFAPGNHAWGTEDPPIFSNKVRIDVR